MLDWNLGPSVRGPLDDRKPDLEDAVGVLGEDFVRSDLLGEAEALVEGPAFAAALVLVLCGDVEDAVVLRLPGAAAGGETTPVLGPYSERISGGACRTNHGLFELI